MLVRLDVSEVKALARDLRIGADRIEPTVQKIVARTGYQVLGTMQTITPVDTGALKGSESVDIGTLSFEAGPTVEHGIYVELGTSEMAAQPYAAPAFDRHLPGAIEDIGDAGERLG